MNDFEVDLTPDTIITPLVEGERVDAIPLIGFLGEERDGRHRLYRDLGLGIWLELEREDIVHRHKLSAERGLLGERSVVWVKRDALQRELDAGEAETRLAAPFLEGAIAEGTLFPRTLEEGADRLTFRDYYTEVCCSIRFTSSLRCP